MLLKADNVFMIYCILNPFKFFYGYQLVEAVV